MEICVLIPSAGRPDKLRRCLRALAAQRPAPPSRVIVALDGGTERDAAELAEALEAEPPMGLGERLELLVFPKVGLIELRARMIEMVHEPVFLSLNDDVVPGPGLLAAHAQAHARAGSPRTPRLVCGLSPFLPVPNASLFDELVRRTGLIFFDPARAADPVTGRVSYRHCFGLNFSAPTAAVREAGGFTGLTNAYGYEDIELAYRLGETHNAAVLYAPDARADHDHRYTPVDLLRREYELGRAAAAFARVRPGFTASLFGRDILAADELAFARAALRHERRDAERIERSVLRLADIPAEAVDPSSGVLDIIAEHWVLLKRCLWRWGVLDGSAGVPRRWGLLSEGAAVEPIAA